MHAVAAAMAVAATVATTLGSRRQWRGDQYEAAETGQGSRTEIAEKGSSHGCT